MKQIVVVTGASAGAGRATVRAFARRGADVGLIARGVDGLEGARREVEAEGGRALVLPTDVADEVQVEAAADRVERELGPIDVWVNNAMVSVFSPVKELQAEEVKRVTDVTYLGVVYGTLAALKRMLPRDRGAIVQVGSALAYRGIPLQAAYCGAKHAIQGFTASLRCELLHDKSRVHVAVVQLPAMNTPQFDWVKSRLPRQPQPVPPIYAPEIAADAIVWAAEHRRRELSVGGTTLAVIWGNKIASGLLDRYLATRGYDTADPAARRSQPARQSVGAASGRPRSARSVRRAQHQREPADLGQRTSGAGVRARSRRYGADVDRTSTARATLPSGRRSSGERPHLRRD